MQATKLLVFSARQNVCQNFADVLPIALTRFAWAPQIADPGGQRSSFDQATFATGKMRKKLHKVINKLSTSSIHIDECFTRCFNLQCSLGGNIAIWKTQMAHLAQVWDALDAHKTIFLGLLKFQPWGRDGSESQGQWCQHCLGPSSKRTKRPHEPHANRIKSSTIWVISVSCESMRHQPWTVAAATTCWW